MPILDIEVVASDSTQGLPADLTRALADMAAKVFNTPQGTVSEFNIHIIYQPDGAGWIAYGGKLVK